MPFAASWRFHQHARSELPLTRCKEAEPLHLALMTRHSKNSTSSAVFTSAERARLEYGTQETRAGKDSFRQIDACHICLHRAKEPVLCSQGHLHCRPCILDSMLAQMETFKLKKAEYEAWKAKQVSLEATKVAKEEALKLERFKRESEGSIESLSKRTKTGDEKAMKVAYWLPENAPKAKEAVVKPPAKTILCKATSEEGHPITLKQLISIQFTYQDDKQIICPVCLKALGNATQMSALISCGHVCCQECIKSFVNQPSNGKDQNIEVDRIEKQCPKCDEKVSGVLEVSRDGTGFAAAGGNVLLKKYTNAAVI